MIHKNQRIDDFAQLGQFLKAWTKDEFSQLSLVSLQEILKKNQGVIASAFLHNGWFTRENVKHALGAWGEILNKKNLEKWVANQPEPADSKRIGIIMAGNIPLVGFHDLLSVLISGHKAIVKMSRDDDQLYPVIFEALFAINPEWSQFIEVVPQLKNIDAVIATGSNNTARYFQHYFEKYPHIIRKNRHSVAFISGDETEEELNKLGEDIFRYFGLGCRNVSQVMIPKEYDLNKIFGQIVNQNEVIQNKKYGNNYDYNKAIFLMNKADLLENGFVLFKEDEALGAPVGMVHYTFYEDKDSALRRIQERADEIQCVVASHESGPNWVPFGQSQQPGLTDYADGVNVLDFLASL